MAQFIAATVPVEREGMTSPLMDQAMQVGEPPSTEDDKPAAPKNEPPVGSFEGFMATFGPRMAR